MMKETKINNEVIHPVKINNNVDLEKVKGKNLFKSLYYNCGLLASTKSGKTTTINHILKKTTDKKTMCFIFCSTASVDGTWKEILQFLRDRGNFYQVFHSIYEGKINQLDMVINQFLKDEEEEILLHKESDKPKEELPKSKPSIKCDDEKVDLAKPTKKEYKPKKLSPKICIIIDDIPTNELVKSLNILRRTRHAKANVFVSSQYANDFSLSVMKQLSYFLVFRGVNKDKLDRVYELCDIQISRELFEEIYHTATKEPFSFLYIDIRNQLFRRNFNTLIEIS